MNSNLLKIARAVDGDDFFAMRVKISCELGDIPYTRDVLLTVAQAVADAITVDDAGAVSTSGVTDEAIIAALPQAETAKSEAEA
jgi:hypothetical protein